MKFKQGERVHIDTDNEEWGRVASDGTVVGCFKNNEVLICVDSIRANILVPLEYIFKRETTDEIQYQCQDCGEWLAGEDENKNLVCRHCQEKRG